MPLFRCFLFIGMMLASCPSFASADTPWGSSESTLPSSSPVHRLLSRFESAGIVRGLRGGWLRNGHPISRLEATSALKSVLGRLDAPVTESGWRYGDWGYRQIDRIYRSPLMGEGIETLRPELERLGVDVDRELLMEALDRNDLATVRELRKRARSPLIQGRYGVTVLMLASAYGDVPLMESELAAGAHPEVMDSSGATALFYAAAFGTAAAVERLAKAGAALDQHEVDYPRRTPLIYAAIGGRVHTARALLRLGANPLETATWNRRASYFVPTINGEMGEAHRRVKKILREAEAAGSSR